MLMTRRMGKALRWFLCGGAFVAVITASGCANHRVSRAPNNTVPAKPQAENTDPLFDNSLAPVEIAPVVNVFGELDGNSPQLSRPASESGFQQHTFADEGYDNDAAVSPDGKWLVFSSTRHNEHP